MSLSHLQTRQDAQAAGTSSCPPFAQRAALLQASAIRALLSLAGRDDVVSLAGGLPDAGSFDVQSVREAADRVLRERPEAALQYGPTEGIEPLRAWVAESLAGQGLNVTPEQVLITTGSQQGLDLLGKVLLDPGSTVLAERESYLGALQAFALYAPVLRGLDADDEGPLPAALDAALPDARLVYLQPRFSNPTGRSITARRGRELASRLAPANAWLVEDDPYGELWFDAPPPPTLAAHGVPHGVTLGSFSKVLAPGLRLGWVAGPAELIEKLALAKQSSDLQSPSLNQWLVLDLLRSGVVARGLPALRALYRARRDAMLAALEAHMPEGVRWTRPEGGFFIWVTLPAGLRASALLPAALARGVAFVPGAGFTVGAVRDDTLRLSFSTADAPSIARAVARLGDVVREAQAATRAAA